MLKRVRIYFWNSMDYNNNMHKAQISQLLMSNQQWLKRAESNIFEDSFFYFFDKYNIFENSWMNSYKFIIMRAYYSFVSAFYISKILWNGPNFMILLVWDETISVHSVFGTCLCNGRAQDR